MKRVLVTGADGFVGSHVCKDLVRRGFSVVGALWANAALPEGCDSVVVGDICAETDWAAALQGVDTVVHLAARVHVMRDTVADPLAEFRRVNVAGTKRLAESSVAAGVRRFIFMSSIKVNGESTPDAGEYASLLPDAEIADGGTNQGAATEFDAADRGRDPSDQSLSGGPCHGSFKEIDPPAPEDPYGVSKMEAETALRETARGSSMDTVVIRAPLIYGPGVKGNFAGLMRLARKPVPLPLGAIQNHRSLLFVGNLADFIVAAVEHPAAANQLFLVSDGADMSTTELLRGLREAMGKSPWLIPVPAGLFRLAGKLTGKGNVVKRLYGSLIVDSSKAQRLLGWKPPFSVREGLELTVRGGHTRDSRVIRLLDIVFSFLGLIVGSPVLLGITIAGLFDTGSPLFLQKRVGRGQRPFTLVKFRTMKKGTESVATHLADEADITPLGRFLRRTKLDELPQLWNVLKGEMSLVGPRPCLYNQTELIAERENQRVWDVRPGITGLAQINDIDMSTPKLLAETDARMMANLTLIRYFGYIFATILGRGAGDRVRNAATNEGRKMVSDRVKQRIYLSPPHMSARDRELLLDAFDSNWVAPLGPHVDAFEREFASKVGIRHAVALSSGTAALHIGLQLVGVGAGDEVITSSLTFVATANAIKYLSATPVFVDSDPQSWNMDPQRLEEAIADGKLRGRLTKAVVPVDLYGQCADYDAICAICKREGIPLVEDAAEALGATYRGQSAGQFGVLSCFSFNGNKIITTSGGGMLATESEELATKARYLATHARDPAVHYRHSEVGYNYRMSNLLAAVGRGQLTVLDERVEKRRENFRFYESALSELPGIKFMPEPSHCRSTRWLTCIVIDSRLFRATREDVRLALEEENIEARPIWKPMHHQPVYRGYRMFGGDVSAHLFADGLCLPSGSNLTDDDRERVVAIIKAVHVRK